MLYINSTWEIRNRKLLLLHIKTKKKKFFSCDLNDFLCHFCVSSMTGWLVPVSSVSLLALAGCRAYGALSLVSLYSLFLQVLENVVVASAFTWPKNETHMWEALQDCKCSLTWTSALTVVWSRGPKPSRHLKKYFIQNVTPIIYSYY